MSSWRSQRYHCSLPCQPPTVQQRLHYRCARARWQGSEATAAGLGSYLTCVPLQLISSRLHSPHARAHSGGFPRPLWLRPRSDAKLTMIQMHNATDYPAQLHAAHFAGLTQHLVPHLGFGCEPCRRSVHSCSVTLPSRQACAQAAAANGFPLLLAHGFISARPYCRWATWAAIVARPDTLLDSISPVIQGQSSPTGCHIGL